MTTRIGVLLSGRGSNFLALHSAMEKGLVPARIALVVTDRPEAEGLQKARQLRLPTAVAVPPSSDPSGREAHEEEILALLEEARVEWICLAGYMRLLTPRFVARYPQRILNIHPSLLPSFPGLRAQRQAIEYGVRVSGCTVHLVDQGLDSGPIVIQRVVEIDTEETVETLSEKILVREHQAYPEALRRLLTEKWVLKRRRLRFL